MRILTFVVCTFLIFLFSLTIKGQKPAFLVNYDKVWVDSVFNSLTLDQKIGQLLMPRGNYSGKPHDLATLESWVTKYHIGGVVFFASNPTAQVNVTNRLQSITKTPLFIGQDFEWGVGMRLDSSDRFPYAIALGAIQGNDALMKEMGREIARQCQRLGVHINYAPVIDINNNPNNPVINFRSMGSDREIVANKGLAYMQGMQEGGLITTAKHFPGHGDTDVDSHHDLPIIKHDRQRLNDVELYPFKKLINAGLSGVMIAHLDIPSLEPQKGLAATFSKNIVTKLLRDELKFEGLTFTDAMEMQGAVKNFPKGEAMVKALEAGSDILETFMDVPLAFEAIKSAILNKKLDIKLVDEKVIKILKAKSWAGLNKSTNISTVNLIKDLNTLNAKTINHQLTEKSITCLKNTNNIIPIKNLTQKIAVLTIEGDDNQDFAKACALYTKITQINLPKNASDSLIKGVIDAIKDFDIIIAAAQLVDIRASKNYGINEANKKIIKALSKNEKVIFALLGNPFILGKIEELKDFKTLILGYQQNSFTASIAAQIIFGGLDAEGKLPVGVNQNFTQGMGVNISSLNRLSYGTPEQVGINSQQLNQEIDSLILLGITKKAFPGAVVQVTRKGKVIFQKSYGTQIFTDNASSIKGSNTQANITFINDAMDNIDSFVDQKNKQIVKSNTANLTVNHLYDLASITKIAASTLAVMQLMSEQKFDLDANLDAYYPAFIGTNKASLKMRNLLTHTAGLKAWIPFWKEAIDSVATLKNALALTPALDTKLVKTAHKPGFFKRLFGKKTTYTVDFNASLSNAQLWKDVLNPQTITWKEGYFSNVKKSGYTSQINKTMWLNDGFKATMINDIAQSPLDTTLGYVYSDLYFYLYPEIVKNITGAKFVDYLRETYVSLGANSLTFLPIKQFTLEQIVPTEYDSLFRKTLIHGFVHDEGAALMEGISGHAGLFGNANDLTKLMQMYLQKGSYGGRKYISPDVITECTQYQFGDRGVRRAIGFDKKDLIPIPKNAPSLSSSESYGHSGFTGTYTWVDPKYDLVYVFLSNRVNPTRDNSKINDLNIRTEIGNIVIRNILTNSKIK